MTPAIEAWRKYLRRDPTHFLLDPDANASVYIWYLIDIAHRPEDSAAVLQARERVLYSPPVQEIFAAQNGEGYWEAAGSLSQPYYRATLWNLALLAELGISRSSRRARAAAEFAVANFLDENGSFRGLNFIESAYLIHALAYFRPAADERVARAGKSLAVYAKSAHSVEEMVMFLWAWADLGPDRAASGILRGVCERLLDSLTVSDFRQARITFPPFVPLDPLFVLRVLAIHGCAGDPRASKLVDDAISRQNERAQWPLEKALNGSLVVTLEEESSESRWATLNALRVIVKLVDRGGQK